MEPESVSLLAQLNTTTFWIGLAIIVLIALIWKPAGRALGKILDTRTERIREELDRAVQLREEAQTLLGNYQQKLLQAMQEAEEIIESARKEADQMVADAQKSIEKTMDKRIQLATEKISMAEKSVLQDVKTQAIDISIHAARTLIKEQAKQGGDRALLEQTLQDIPRKVQQ